MRKRKASGFLARQAGQTRGNDKPGRALFSVIPARGCRARNPGVPGLLILLALSLIATSAFAQFTAIPNYSGVGAGQQFRNDVNNHLSGVSPIAPRLVAVPFSVLALTPETDAQVYWCRDCAQGPVCTSGGQGAAALGANGQWTCVLGPLQQGISPLGVAGGDLASSYPNPRVNTVLGGQIPVTTVNGVSALSPSTASYSMGNNRITSVATDSTLGDALSRGQSSLSALTPPTAAFGMNGQTLQSVGVAAVSGQPLVGGVTNPVASTQVSINGALNVKAQFGAKGDTRSAADAVTNGTTTLVSATINFTTVDIGKAIAINGANGVPTGTTIVSVTNATTAIMSAAATGSSSALSWWLGTNDGAAILAAAQAACTLSVAGTAFCTSPLYFPPGTYYTRGLVLNPSTIGGGVATAGLHLICAGKNGRGFATLPTPTLTSILVDNNPGSVGIDMFANSAAVIENCDLRTLTTSTGPKALLAYGKTQGCDCDDVTLRNDSFESWSTNNIGTVFSLGGEDTDIQNSFISAFNGGHAVVWSATNAVGGGVTSTGELLYPPGGGALTSNTNPISMIGNNIRASLLYVNGGVTANAPPPLDYISTHPPPGRGSSPTASGMRMFS